MHWFINTIGTRDNICAQQHIWATSWENLFMPHASNKGADQSSLNIRNFKPLASFCGCADRFVPYLVANPEDRFSRDDI